MLRQPPPRDPIAADARRAAATRRAGENARCPCGENRPEALVTPRKPIVCAACARKKKGKNPMDKHHPAGRANSRVTVSVPVNDHRAHLSVDQYDWPRRTRENPDGSPLIAAAGSIRGFIDTVQYLMESLLTWIADMLELLDEYMSERFGAKWWRGTELARFAPKGGTDVIR